MENCMIDPPDADPFGMLQHEDEEPPCKHCGAQFDEPCEDDCPAKGAPNNAEAA